MIVDTQKIDELPLAGKLELLEAISDALSRDVSKFESPTWHQKVLQEREYELDEPQNWLSLDTVKKALNR